METLEQQLTALKTDLTAYFQKAAEQEKTRGQMDKDTLEKITTLQKQVDALDVKLAEKHATQAAQEPGLETQLREDEEVARLMRNKKGHAVITLKGKSLHEMQRKTTISSSAVGAQTTGVLQIERIPGIVEEARQELTVRDALTARPTTMQVVDFVKVLNHMTKASPQTEGSDKGENAVTFQAKSETVRTIATWVPASRQVLDDFQELMNYLQGSLTYYVNLEEEKQMLSGDGTGQNLDGLITQATAFDTTLLPAAAGWNKIDIVGRVIQQIMAAKELKPTFIILHPTDWWGMRLQKDSYGRYILGDPQQPAGIGAMGQWISPLARTALFDLQPIVTTSVTSGTFLVGSGSPVAAEIRDRMEMTVEISTEHSDYFTKNLVAIRGEKRMVLIVKRPASYITGTFTTSP